MNDNPIYLNENRIYSQIIWLFIQIIWLFTYLWLPCLSGLKLRRLSHTELVSMSFSPQLRLIAKYVKMVKELAKAPWLIGSFQTNIVGPLVHLVWWVFDGTAICTEKHATETRESEVRVFDYHPRYLVITQDIWLPAKIFE